MHPPNENTPFVPEIPKPVKSVLDILEKPDDKKIEQPEDNAPAPPPDVPKSPIKNAIPEKSLPDYIANQEAVLNKASKSLAIHSEVQSAKDRVVRNQVDNAKMQFQQKLLKSEMLTWFGNSLKFSFLYFDFKSKAEEFSARRKKFARRWFY